MNQNDFKKLFQRLGYTFQDTTLMVQALTHCSASSKNNERLEFLGDAILSFVMAQALFHLFPEAPEGELSRVRAHLVKGDTLAELAMQIGLGNFLYLGQGELKSGGHRRASILADALEALIAAVYLDSNMKEVEALIKRLYQDYLKDKNLLNSLKDAKTLLQEYLQAHKQALPTYQLVKTMGEDHAQTFYVTCQVIHLPITEGIGNTRRKAEQEAARKLLYYLKTCE